MVIEKATSTLPASVMIEAMGEIAEMRRIYTAIESGFFNSGPKSIVVSSAVMSEGKTLTAAGLAIAAARQSQKRVIALDLNWFRPALHTIFGLEKTFGIDRVENGMSLSDLAQPSGIDHLDILPAPLLSQHDMPAGSQLNRLAENIIEKARDAYDIVFIDTSALYPTNRRMVDPVVFSAKTAGVVLVALSSVTPRKQVKRALMTLETSGANVLGVVANQRKTS